MGRKAKLTPEVQKALVEAATVGATDEMCCSYAGIGKSTMYRWLEQGEAGRSPYREFREAFTRAREKCAVSDLATISEAARGIVVTYAGYTKRHPKKTITHKDGRVEVIEAWEEVIPPRSEKRPGDWRAAGWRLAHRYPENFGKLVVENRHTNETGSGPVRVEGAPDLRGVTREKLAELAAWEDDPANAGATPTLDDEG